MKNTIKYGLTSFFIFNFVFVVLHAIIWGDKSVNLKSQIGYFVVASLIATLLFVVSVSSLDKEITGLRKKTAICFMVLGNFYIFLLAMNLIYEFDENMILVITLSGLSIFLFDISYSLFDFNKKILKSNGEWYKHLGLTLKMIFMLVIAVISMGAFIFYLGKVFISMPKAIEDGIRVINESKLFTSFITLFPIGLALLYLSHKVEKSEDGFKDLPWK